MKIFSLVLSMCLFTGCAAQTGSQPVTLTSLAGSEWAPVNAENEQFIQFKDDGSVAGNGGCNRFFGNYSQNADRLTIGPLGATEKACFGVTNEQEFFEALEETKRVDATPLVLSLKNEAGEVLMILERKDWD
jgi:heat shock protein HslJ